MFVAVEIKCLAAKIVGAALGHDIDKAGVGSADFGICTRANDLKFTDRSLRKEKDLLISAALIALQRIVKIRAVNRDI